MKHIRVTCAVLICAALTLGACADDETTPTAGSTPATSVTTSSASPVVSQTPAGDAEKGDKELCESVKKAGSDMKKEFLAAVQSGGDPSPALKKVLAQMDKTMTTLSAGKDSAVTEAMKKFGAEAAKAAAAADPATAASNSSFEQAGADVTAACKPTGVDVNF